MIILLFLNDGTWPSPRRDTLTLGDVGGEPLGVELGFWHGEKVVDIGFVVLYVQEQKREHTYEQS
jgi:hypothetical protein